MNYYERHIGDYIKSTVRLSMLEDGAYNRLIDEYYQSEQPLPADLGEVYRIARAYAEDERKAVDYVLKTYFKLDADGYRQKRIDIEIERYADKQRKAKASAEARWSKTKGNANASESDADGMRTHSDGNAHQTPNTNHQTPDESTDAGASVGAGRSEYSPEFEEAWAAYPKRAGGNSKKDAFKAWRARCTAGIAPAFMIDGVKRYAAFLEATGKIGTEYVKQAATFFGPAGHYAEAWALPSGLGAGQSLANTDYGTNGLGGVLKL